MAQETNNSPISVEQLIQLKRAEKPDATFWQEFDRSFQERRLRQLMEAEPDASLRKTRWLRWTIVAGGLPAATFSLLLATVGLDPLIARFAPATVNGPSLAVTPSASRVTPMEMANVAFTSASTTPTMTETPRGLNFVINAGTGRLETSTPGFAAFANDALSVEAPTASFRRVFTPNSLLSDPAPAHQYVAEPLTSTLSDTKTAFRAELF